MRTTMRLAAGLLALAAALSLSTADEAKSMSGTRAFTYVHLYSDANGVSHFRDETVPLTTIPGPNGPGQALASYALRDSGGAQLLALRHGAREDWHKAPAKTFTINVVGDIEGEVSDGTKVRIGKGDLVYLEDLTGKGHVTRLLTPVANLFIRMKPDFDFLKWASEPPTTSNIWN